MQNGEVGCEAKIEKQDEHESISQLDRRTAVRILSMSALATVAGCGGGSTSNTSSSSSGPGATTTTITASAPSVLQGNNITLTAVVSPAAATGAVVFYEGTNPLGAAQLSGGTATLTTNNFSFTGPQVLTAVYQGNSTYNSSTSAALSFIVLSSVCSSSVGGDEGAYFVDDSASGYQRVNIVTNLDGTNTQGGIPLALSIYVYDSGKSCVAMQGVQVDIWHCNAMGVFSGISSQSTAGQSWLRGYQITDATGKVSFNTIIPGWYAGSSTHIHLRFRSTYDKSATGSSNTMQLFFDQASIDSIDTTVVPYSSLGRNPTTNVADPVYSNEENGTTQLTLSGGVATGLSATFVAYMPV